ncbi:MAG: type I-E CRISPR-associated protein Cas6/Cse3/CasE [candidate division WS1 bacterium]|jgi:CRISPR system Cascade subunit CasE|nr:type I-E CRISPR-associated protein Cas6/Cse3/CasE [candidate division WS1 bacterium]
MYLSRLILNPRNRQVRSELACPYEMHRTIARAFGEDYEDDRILYRVDVERRTGVATVLVQSLTEPDWSVLPDDRYLLEPADSKPIAPGVSEGQLLSFRLRANPVKREKESGRRQGLLQEEEQRAWLERQGERSGFRVVRCHVIPEGLQEFLRRSNGDERKVTLLSVRFEGLLQVTDPDALGAAVRDGIGPAKAFGFGLLSLARA